MLCFALRGDHRIIVGDTVFEGGPGKTWAAEDFQTVLRRDPESIESTLNLSRALWNLDRHDEARTLLYALVEHNPRHVPTLNRMAEWAWASCATEPDAYERHRQATMQWCRRSLEIDRGQPDIAALLQSAEDADLPL